MQPSRIDRSHGAQGNLGRGCFHLTSHQGRSADAAARLGGDEFAVVLIDASAEEAAQVAAELVNDLSAPYQLDELTVGISASIGVAGFPDCGVNSKALLQHADNAMYEAKALGKRQIVVAPSHSQLDTLMPVENEPLR